MKPTEQISSTAKNMSQAAKTKVAKKAKPMARKAATSAKRSIRTAGKRARQQHSAFAGYSDSAARLIARGKTAFGDAYAWAGEASSALPRTRRDLGLRDMKAMIDDRPLIIGAVGLGIGVALGSMLPAVSLSGKGRRTPDRTSHRK